MKAKPERVDAIEAIDSVQMPTPRPARKKSPAVRVRRAAQMAIPTQTAK